MRGDNCLNSLKNLSDLNDLFLSRIADLLIPGYSMANTTTQQESGQPLGHFNRFVAFLAQVMRVWA